MFAHWPHEQTLVLQSLTRSPSAVYSCLTMAHDEMKRITDLDIDVLRAHHHKVHLYFAEDDGWVGEQKKCILAAFEQEEGNVRVVHGHPDIPHAFCISKLRAASPHNIISPGFVLHRPWRTAGTPMLRVADLWGLCFWIVIVLPLHF